MRYLLFVLSVFFISNIFSQNSQTLGKDSQVLPKPVKITLDCRPKLDFSNPPFFVLDDEIIQKEELNNIAPNNINSVSLLKGKEAIKKYGSKVKNGVVVIASKKIINHPLKVTEYQ